MKRIIFISIAAFVLVFLSGCSPEKKTKFNTSEIFPKSSQVDLETFIEDRETEEVTEKTPFLRGDDGENAVCIGFSDLGQWDKKLLTRATDRIHTEVEEYIERKVKLSPSEEGLTKEDFNSFAGEWIVSLDGRIAYRSEEITSVVFEGSLYERIRKSPDHCLLAYNFDPDGNLISFEYPIDDALYDVFAENGDAALRAEADEEWLKTYYVSFSENLCSREEFLEGLREGSVQWFYTEEGICFSYPVGHALGDHREVTVPYSYFAS